MIDLRSALQQISVTDALIELYGPVRLNIVSQDIVSNTAAPYENFFAGSSDSILERRIRLIVLCEEGKLKPIVSAVSWIRIDGLSPEAQRDLAAGSKMLGAIMAEERGTRLHDYGATYERSPECATELLVSPDTTLISRWRYWSNESGKRLVLLRECAPVFGPKPSAADLRRNTEIVTRPLPSQAADG